MKISQVNPGPSILALTYLFVLISFMLCEPISSDLQIVNVVDNQFQKIFFVHQQNHHFFLTLSCKQKNMLSIFISTEQNHQTAPRFNIYGSMNNTPKMAQQKYTMLSQCQVTIGLNTSSFIEIRRIETASLVMAINEVSFRSLLHRFIVRDESVKWGMGERFQKNFDLKDGKWTIWNRDKPWKIDKGSLISSDQTYGHHPVYLARERATRLYHLVYFRNTHGVLLESSLQTDRLVFNAAGGSIHIILICGQQDPEQVIEQYHSYIGSSHIPPFWSLGFHQSRWGYRNFQKLEQVVSKFKKHNIPLDCFWTDLDYMKDKQIFTIDEKKFPPKDMNNLINKYELHYVPLLDVAISVNDLHAVKLGMSLNVFFQEKLQFMTAYYTGEVWPGKVYYIDYLHPNASVFWDLQMKRLNKKIDFSGIWLDMNEPTNFKGGLKSSEESLKIQQSQNINVMTIDVDLKHHSDTIENLLHREVHSYYGHLSAVPTFQYLKEHGRPFIISRSTSVGSGLFAGHWTGDNVANWEFLRLSINGNFLFQIFGIQMVGADICGFYKDTTEDLCSRWMQLGSFYPFARNHNHQQAINQQPYELGEILLQTSKLSLNTRYSLLKYFYTLMVGKQGRGSIFRPLSFEFFNDESVYEEQTIETQFLIGRSLMVAPIVYEFDETRYVYFPGQNEDWYQFEINIRNGVVRAESVHYFLSSSLEFFENKLPAPPLTFFRGGYILFTNKPMVRSHYLTNNFNLFVTLKQNRAKGEIMGINDYEYEPHIQKCISQGCFFSIVLLKFETTFILEWQFIGDVQIMGEIFIEDIFIISKKQRWKYTEKISISSLSGSFYLTVDEF